MKKIMAVILSLLFIAPANATITDIPSKRPDIATEAPIRNSDILLTCWVDYPDAVNKNKDMVSIIVSPDNDIATMIDPHNDIITGKLTVSEYFYTITVDQLINSSRTGVIKINRLSGVLSVVRTAPKTESRSSPKVLDAKYGTCILTDRKQLF